MFLFPSFILFEHGVLLLSFPFGEKRRWVGEWGDGGVVLHALRRKMNYGGVIVCLASPMT